MGKEPAGNTVNLALMSSRFVLAHFCSHATAHHQRCVLSLCVHAVPAQEGDHIGLMRKASGALHFYINGIDQGEEEGGDG